MAARPFLAARVSVAFVAMAAPSFVTALVSTAVRNETSIPLFHILTGFMRVDWVDKASELIGLDGSKSLSSVFRSLLAR